MATTKRLTRQGDMVDLIAWLHYGASGGNTEALLDRVPDLCNQPVVLPAGYRIALPELDPPGPEPAQPVRLWD